MTAQKKQSGQHISGRRVVILIAVSILFFILLSSVINLGKKYSAIQGKLHELSKEEGEVTDKQAALKEKNDFLMTPDGEERILREKYDVVRPGEGVIIVTEPDTSTMATNEKSGSWIGNFWRAIVHGLGFGHD